MNTKFKNSSTGDKVFKMCIRDRCSNGGSWVSQSVFYFYSAGDFKLFCGYAPFRSKCGKGK